MPAWIFAGGGEFRAPGVLCWLGACTCWIAGWWPDRPEQRADADGLSPAWTGALFAAIFVAAVFFSFYRLSHMPGNPTSDHAETLLDVQDLLDGQRPIYFARNTGREPLKFYWLWLLVAGAGLPAKYMTLKIATALLGLLAIPAMYLLGREMGGQRMGLLAAALVAIAKWHFSMARIGLRVTYAVFPTAMVLWALLRYLRRGDRRSALWAGIWIGIGLYTYIPFRVVPLLVPVALALAALDPRRKGRRRALVGAGLLAGVTAMLIFLPLLRYMADRPQMFWYRAATRASSVEHVVGPRPLSIFATNVGRMALALHWKGTGTVINALEWDPFLDPVTGALFLAGLVLALVAVLRGSRRWALVGIALFVLTLPSTLSIAFPKENPSINRSVTAIPAVFLVAALPLAEILRRSRGGPRAVRLGAATAIIAILAVAGRQNFVRYFVDFDRMYPYYVHPSREIAAAIETYRARGVPLANVYLLSVPNWVDARNIAFELGDPAWTDAHNVAPGDPPPWHPERPLVFIFKQDDTARRAALPAVYAGKEELFPQPIPGRTFGAYVVR